VPKTAGLSIFTVFGHQLETRLSHFTPAEAKQFIFQETWSEYWKFAFVRNPWDRYVSLYEFHRQSDYIFRRNVESKKIAMSNNFKDWVYLNYNKFVSSTWFSETQSIWWKEADVVFKMEEMDSAIEEIKQHMPMLKPLDRINTTQHSAYQSYYTSKSTIDMIARLEHETIEKFGYTF
jgi:hypothetical protein